MDLPVRPPVAPMLAKPVDGIPSGDYVFEPKWDGFRTIVFRDGDEVEFGSRNERPMTRYFPELVEATLTELPPRCVIDGEIVLPDFAAGRLDFEALQLRLHPAASRVRLLAAQTPAHFVAFDLLALGSEDYTERPFAERRAALETALSAVRPPIHLTPATTDRAVAGQWFTQFEGAGLDGLIAKSPEGLYEPDKRVMFKVKHERTADCVVAGYRPHKTGDDAIGSLLLGLYRPTGELASVGGIGAVPKATRGTGRSRSRAPAPRAAPSTAGGTWARTCRLSRCAPSAWSRSATTTWRGRASGTRRSASAGAPPARPPRARSSSWKSPSVTACRKSWERIDLSRTK